MSFTASCFIKKNTFELGEKLEELGREKVFYSDKDAGIVVYDDNTFDSISESEIIDTAYIIDCGINEPLFLALAALRDDSDYMQWFTDGGNFIQSMTNVYIGNPRYRKTTASELVEHFKTEDQ